MDPGVPEEPDTEPDPETDPSLVLEPNDPDAPDEPSPIAPDSPAVGPNDPDAPDPVPPATGDSPALPPDDPDAVSPGPGNPGPYYAETIALGMEDVTAKGTGVEMDVQTELETIGMDQTGVMTTDGVIDIADFRVGEDVLSIEVDGAGDAAEIAVQPSEDGADGLVVMDGEVIAILRGAPAATELDVRLIAGSVAA